MSREPVFVKQIIEYALTICEEHRDSSGELNLISLDAALMDHFDLGEEEYEERDLGYVVFKELDRHGLID